MTIRVFPSRLEGEPLETHETTEQLSVAGWLAGVAPGFSLDAKDKHPTIRLNGRAVEPSEWPLTFFGPRDQLDVYIEARGVPEAIVYGIILIVSIFAGRYAAKNAATEERRRGVTMNDPGAMANQVRWGDPIPEIAGAPITYPDYLAPPRRYYVGKTQQWFDSLVCIGRGKYQIDPSQVFVGETSAPSLGDDLEIVFYGPGETLAPEHAEWWHTPEEVGFTTFGGAGMTLGPLVSVSGFWAGTFVFAGNSITGLIPPPPSWETGMLLRVEAEHPLTFSGNSVQSELLDTLGLSTGDEIELTGERSGTYTIASILPGTGGTPGSPATATGSTAPARLDFGTAHGVLGVSINGASFTASLTADVADLAELVTVINGQFNGTPIRARAQGVALELYQVEPYNGGSLALAGSVADLFGVPTIAAGVSAAPAIGTRYTVSGADFGTGVEIAAAGASGLLYSIASITGNSIAVTPPGVVFWPGFPANVSNATSGLSLDRSSMQGGWIGPFTAVPRGEQADAFEIDIFFPQGLIRYNKKGRVRSRQADWVLNWRYLGETSWRQPPSFRNEEATPDQIGFTYRIELPEPGRVEVRIRSVYAPSDDSNKSDRQQWTGLRARLVGGPTRYPDLTVAHVRLRSGDKVSGGVENKLAIRAMRILPTVENPLVEAPTRDIAPFFIYMMQTVGYGRGLLDMPHLEALHTIWRDRGDTFDLSVNGSSTLKAVANYCLGAGFAELTVMHGKISAARDAYRMGSPPRVYSPQEMASPLVEQIGSVLPDDIDGVDVEYVDYLTGRTLTESYRLIGDEGRRVEKIQVPGVSGATQAWRLAARRRRLLAYRRAVYAGSTELAAMNSYYMDYVGLQDGIPEWGQSAFVMAHEGRVLTLSEEIEPVGGEPVAMIRRADGTASPPIPATVSGRTLTLAAMPPDVTVTDDPNHPTVVYIGRRTQVVHEALMTEVRPSGEGRVDFNAVNMDNRVYLEDDMGPNQVILTSRPYELESTESAGMIAGTTSLLDREVLFTGYGEEAAGAQGIASGLSLRAVLYDLEPPQPTEDAAMSAAASGLYLKEVRITTNQGVEAAANSAAADRVFLQDVLVVHRQPGAEEAANSAAANRVFLNEQ